MRCRCQNFAIWTGANKARGIRTKVDHEHFEC